MIAWKQTSTTWDVKFLLVTFIQKVKASVSVMRVGILSGADLGGGGEGVNRVASHPQFWLFFFHLAALYCIFIFAGIDTVYLT